MIDTTELFPLFVNKLIFFENFNTPSLTFKINLYVRGTPYVLFFSYSFSRNTPGISPPIFCKTWKMSMSIIFWQSLFSEDFIPNESKPEKNRK